MCLFLFKNCIHVCIIKYRTNGLHLNNLDDVEPRSYVVSKTLVDIIIILVQSDVNTQGNYK